MKPVVVVKIRASWNFSSAHWLHNPMNGKNHILILKWKYLEGAMQWHAVLAVFITNSYAQQN